MNQPSTYMYDTHTHTVVTTNLVRELVKGGPCFAPHFGLVGLEPPHDILQGG